jgi:hypothetical protein
MCHAWEVQNVDIVEDKTCKDEPVVRYGLEERIILKFILEYFALLCCSVEVMKLKVLVLPVT